MGLEDIRFSQTETRGKALYRMKGETIEILFENVRTGTGRTLVDRHGWIVEYPGIAHPDLAEAYCGEVPDGQIHYVSRVTELDGQYALLWKIQPDGRYWEDEEGFGGTSDDEILLYAPLDEEGLFTAPFRIYSVGSSEFYGTNKEEELAAILAQDADPEAEMARLAQRMLEEMRAKIRIPEAGEGRYAIPGTICEAGWALQEQDGEWFADLSLKKRESGVTRVTSVSILPLERQRKYLGTERAREEMRETLIGMYRRIDID